VVRSLQQIGKRSKQEDAFYIDEELGLYIVCDGMGGYKDGDIASQSVIKSIVAYLRQKCTNEICTNYIKDAVRFAQKELNKIVSNDLISTKIGTTLALLHYKEGKAITAHLGDSKIVLLNNKANSIWSTKDHTLVQELYDAGVLNSEEEMYNHPLKNRITNALYLGQELNELNITIHVLNDISKGDAFLIFSDGIMEAFKLIDLVQFINDYPKENFMSKLSEVLTRKSSDNSTLLIINI